MNHSPESRRDAFSVAPVGDSFDALADELRAGQG